MSSDWPGVRMYYAMIVMLMGLLPAGSVAIEQIGRPGTDMVLLIGKWFVFWTVGLRLLLAGVRQTLNPAFTAKAIFEIEDAAAFPIVRELGFWNLIIGLLGSVSLLAPVWVLPLAIAGGAFYGLAGLQHLLKKHRNTKENWAMVSDLVAFGVLAFYAVTTVTK